MKQFFCITEWGTFFYSHDKCKNEASMYEGNNMIAVNFSDGSVGYCYFKTNISDFGNLYTEEL